MLWRQHSLLVRPDVQDLLNPQVFQAPLHLLPRLMATSCGPWLIPSIFKVSLLPMGKPEWTAG